jgi:organic hydroperoxide reductase OsmC/OhrA
VTSTSTGGRDGTISSTPTDETAPLNLKFRTPKALGGNGESGHNPEQLFAAGYSGKLIDRYPLSTTKHWYGMNNNTPACFLGAIQVAASRAGKKEVGERAVVNADVSIGRTKDIPGLGIQVVLRIEGVEDQAILDAAHEVGYTVVVLSRPLKLMLSIDVPL